MSRILLFLGFFLPMFVTVTTDHLIKQSAVSEVVDSIITALVFTMFFAIGVRLGRGQDVRPRSERKSFLHGLAAGMVVQALIWGFWLSVPETIRYSFGVWPLVGHVLLIVAVGYTMSRVRRRAAFTSLNVLRPTDSEAG